MHRSHDALTAPALFVDSTTGEVHRPHHISPTVCTAAAKWSKPKANNPYSTD
ncbi:50S ribosomal protein L32 [Neisseria gonorrhoeae]|uniref:Large ribosomal subunit protein bL32 n=1 Tax=Neisseria gonorrhoeae TaxID=485 RepID=A0A378W0D6_NEIGO|nr:50S ribosomal protein L32 [Neisseria gonorrhoeae]